MFSTSTILKVLAADIILVLADFEVYLDLQGRSNYASSLHFACGDQVACSYTPSFSYGPLTSFFEMAGNGRMLVSPPTLDWIQLLTLATIAVNAWFLLVYLRARNVKTQASNEAL